MRADDFRAKYVEWIMLPADEKIRIGQPWIYMEIPQEEFLKRLDRINLRKLGREVKKAFKEAGAL